MCSSATNFPPSTYSSTFLLNSISEDREGSKNDNGILERPRGLFNCFSKKRRNMEFHLSIMILLFAIVNIRGILSTECVEVKKPRTRTFPSLVSYQGNKVPFDPRNSSMGNYVAFDFKEVANLPKNTFVSFDSEHIIKLDLNGKSIQRINDGAFLSLMCLKYLTIRNNSLKEVTRKTFDGLGNLRELDISENKLKELPDMFFVTLTRVVYLDLSNNDLRKLSPFTFANASALQTLNLDKNDLVYIDPDVFNPLKSLQTLDLSFNKFTDSEAHKWFLPSLEILNFSGNYLRNFDTSFNYSFRGLQKLNLSSNYLTELNVHAMKKNFGKLTVIDVNSNYWRCDDLAKILHYLVDTRVRIPARNTSGINELGIDCENYTRIVPIDFPETTTTFSSSIIPTETKTSSNNEVKFGNQIQTLSVKNDEILLEISGIRKLLIFSLLFFVLLVIVYASVQVGLCDSLKRKCSRRDGYIDTSIQDNYSMLRT